MRILDRVFYVAELSANHLGSLERAIRLIESAGVSGASAVKFQTYKPETMTLKDMKSTVSEDHSLWGGQNLFDLYESAMTPWEWHSELFKRARDLNLIAFSSPFDRSAVDFLEQLDCPIYKIASLETSDTDLISYAAETGKPMIISTGASSLEEIAQAVEAARSVIENLTLLVCTSSYPADARDAHILRIQTLKKEFGVKVGLSDHTLGVGVSIAGISLGATVIEKHLTIKRSDGGHDAAFSLEPDEFKLLVEEGNKAHLALGSPEWSIQESEAESRRLRRSLFIAKPVRKGEIATRENIKALRPNTGGPISDLTKLLGRRFKEDYEMGEPASIYCME
jgi:pseudaminic acid synthase